MKPSIFTSAFRKLLTFASRTPTSRRSKQRCTLAMECLEERTVLTVSPMVPNEILIGFDGDVAATYHSRGAAAGIGVAEQLIGDLGLHGGKLLAVSPGVAGHSATMSSRWTLPSGTDVPTMIARLA